MSVKKEASGRRSVQVEVEVPGPPVEVWQAIDSVQSNRMFSLSILRGNNGKPK